MRDLPAQPSTHADLAATPREEAFAVLAQRHHLREPHGFTAPQGRTGRTHLAHAGTGKLLCSARTTSTQDLLVTGPLTCSSCIRQVAKRVHRKFRPAGSSRRPAWQRRSAVSPRR
ncbi:hypothetical protein [Deinococcus soli (ex Cha et al. 2016)]|uniref:Uncharacterized protein n=2 Tax=Deinococcus soli (ex Cha et al. 2016) TaxID=1309411 RepID=A0ACC6KGV1_9DEIO|nr:hypothetical protein [Deinococcus soli (ex Cha et al. 2016)]MDR6219041.1 hypothetical protein [Deinococcus soli (ex Cha et al. 2016)]MDR6328838.1 hypothetical protein [Deinococcus soli (ex Cha et al. 2016)]MDR6751674.1 hypothetical protein [Deinococcus soli (ex Cha et al. 2016)]